MDYSTTCRICLLEQKTLDMKPLSRIHYDNMTFEEVIVFCTGINVLDNSRLYPTNICFKCEESLMKSYEFKQKIIQANNHLETMCALTFKHENDVPTIDMQIEPLCCLADSEKDSFHNNDNNSFDKSLKEEYSSDSVNACSDEYIAEDTLTTEPHKFKATRSRSNRTQKANQIKTSKVKKINEENVCNTCNVKFKTIEELKGHRKISHPKMRSKVKPKLCLICGKLTKNIDHAETHKDPSERESFNCTICCKVYTMKSNLISHMRTHTHPHPYECKYCGKKFRIWSTRSNHIFREHGGKAKYTCNICGKGFFKTHHYKEHMLTHTGERPHKCEICEKGYITASQLKNHMVTHTKEKNFKCIVCQKDFARSRSLREHMKIHTGEKDYLCPVCTEPFIKNHLMRTHVKRKHPDYVLPPSGTIISQKALKKRLKKIENLQESIVHSE